MKILKMEVYIESSEDRREIEFSGKAVDLLKRLEINPVTVILVQNGQLITEEESLDDTDKIEVLPVVSGG